MADYTGGADTAWFTWYYSWVCFIHHQPLVLWVIGRCGVALGDNSNPETRQTIQQISLARHKKDE